MHEMIGHLTQLSGSSIESFQPLDEDATAAVILHPTGEIIACNESFVWVFGFDSVFTALGSNIDEFLPELCGHLWRQDAQEGVTERFTTSGSARDGTPVETSVDAFVALDEMGAASAFRVYFRHLDGGQLQGGAARALAPDNLAQRVDEISPGDVAHNLSNVITAISFHADALVNRFFRDDELRGRAMDIREAAQSAGTMINQLAALASREPKARLHSPQLGGCESILIVEDDHSLRQLMVESLSNRGYCCHAAATGKEAYEVFEQIHEDLDLVVADVVIADTRGPELIEKLRLRKENMRVLLISGFLAGAEHRASAASAYAFLKKPFDSEILCRRVREVLDLPLC